MSEDVVLACRGLKKTYAQGPLRVGVQHGIDFEVRAGEIVAIVGASEDPARVGADPIRALRENGYAGAVYPINPKYESIFGYRCYPSLESVHGDVDLAAELGDRGSHLAP